METQKPFIYKFKNNDKYYVYDINTNNLLLVDKEVYDSIDSENWKENKNIMNSRKNGLLLSKRPKAVKKKIGFEDLKEKLNNNIQMITLFISSDCNMNCGYCYFSESYDNKMKLENKMMTIETAKKTIDFYFSHSNGNRNGHYPIGFYGGEPFLNFKLMKESVKYVKEKYSNKYKDVIFTVTTNLTILNKEILNFLIKNNIHVAVSLDGPKKVHDRYRKLKNGTGSYDIIMKNLNMIYNYNKKYFYEHVVYNVVLAPLVDFVKSYKFFSKGFLSESNFAKVGMLLINGSSKFEEKYKIKINCGIETIKILYKIYEEEVIKNGETKQQFLSRVFNENFMQIHNREMVKMESEIREKGSCIPGMFRPMVDEDGNLYPCEKGGFFELGNIFDGFNYKKCYQLVEDFAKIRNEICLDCWVIRFCGKCYIGAEKDGKLNIDKKLEQCERTKDSYSIYLKRYVEIMERNPNSFQRIREWALQKQEKQSYTL